MKNIVLSYFNDLDKSVPSLPIYLFYFILLLNSYNIAEQINCNYTKVWGPGLDPENVIMPARYFFISAIDNNNMSLNSTPGKETFDIAIYGDDVNICKVWLNVMDLRDGTFIVRYKVYNYCRNLTISIKCNKSHIPNSPFKYSGIIYADDCFCSINDDIEDWLRKYTCKKKFKQIQTDLKQFSEIDFNILYPIAEETLFRDHHGKSVCNYVYRRCYGQYTGFKMFMDAVLLFLTRKVHIPDLEMLVNLGDWPLIKSIHNGTIIPLFSWCGSDDSYDIVMPTYDITESSLENMGRVTMDMLSVQGNIEKKWNEKIEKLYWRGRDSSRERLKLVKIGRENNNLINASLTDFFFFRELEHEYGPKEKRISFFKFFDYKYQINMDGTVAAYRFPYLLVSDSLIFKQDSHYYEHFYYSLKKWKHFIPVKRDLSDLVEKIKWAKIHDEEAHKIAVEGQQFARRNLLPHDIFCYHVQLFHEYSKKIRSDIKIRPDMEEITQSNKKCDCRSVFTKKSPTRDYEDL